MDYEPLGDSDYLTSTNPERFAAVIEFAERMIDELEATYEVQRAEGGRKMDFPAGLPRVLSRPATLLSPSSGVPLAFGFTQGPPGALLRVGANTTVAFPDCGCDACNLQVDELCDDLQFHVDAVTSGGYTEELTRRSHSWSFQIPSRRKRSSHRRLRWREWKRIGTRGQFDWEPWLHRST